MSRSGLSLAWRRIPVSAVVALSLVVSAQCLRVLFSVLYSYRERAGLLTVVVLVVVVFASAGLAPILVRLVGPGGGLLASMVALSALRLGVQAVDQVSVALAVAAGAAAMLALGTALVVLRARGIELAFALVAGLALDTVLRVSWATWDLAWRDGALPALVVVALVVALVVAALVARREAQAASGRVVVPALVVGPLLMLELLFLQSPAFVASSARVGLASASAVMLVADVLAVGVVAFVATGRIGVVTGAACALGLAILCWMLPTVTASSVEVLLILGQLLGVGLFAAALVAPPTPTRRPLRDDALGLVGGGLLFGALVLLYQLHYEQPLPVSNRWLVVVAAVLVGLGASGLRAPDLGAASSLRGSGRLAVVIGLAGAVAAGGLIVSEPGLGATAAAPDTLRVVTFNVHEAVTRQGQLNPDAVARTIERLRPDVVVLEEVARGWPLSGTIDLAEWAKRRLDLPYWWAPAASHQFGNLVLSRVRISDAHLIALPQGSGSMKRSALIAHLGPIAGRPITLVAVHLQNGSSAAREQTRVQEARLLVHAWGRQPHTVLAGDLNADPNSPSLRTLLDAGLSTTQPTRHCTVKTSNQNCVDWILVTPDLHQTTVRAITSVDQLFDHRPLITIVTPH